MNLFKTLWRKIFGEPSPACTAQEVVPVSGGVVTTRGLLGGLNIVEYTGYYNPPLSPYPSWVQYNNQIAQAQQAPDNHQQHIQAYTQTLRGPYLTTYESYVNSIWANTILLNGEHGAIFSSGSGTQEIPRTAKKIKRNLPDWF